MTAPVTYPQETKEFQPIRVKVDGVEVTEGVEIAVLPTNTRPEDEWIAAVLLTNGHLGFLIDDMEPGIWNVWARVTTDDELVVLHCGDFKVTG